MRKAWNVFKELLVKEFRGGNQPPPKLSDRLVSMRDGEVGYEALFSKSPQPARIRK